MRYLRRPRPRKWLLAVLFTALALPPARPSPPRAAPAIRKLEWFTSRDGVVPGGVLELALRVTLQPGFHINVHVPSQEFLIPTSLETEPLPGAAFAGWIYPAGKTRRFPFADDPIQVYEGTALIRGRMDIAADATPGRRRILTRLRYQACTKDRCYPPGREEAVLEFQVVPAGRATRPQHADLFAGGRR